MPIKTPTPDTYEEIIELFGSVMPTEKVRLFREMNNRSGVPVAVDGDELIWPNGAKLHYPGQNAVLSVMSFVETQKPLQTARNKLHYWQERLKQATQKFHELRSAIHRATKQPHHSEFTKPEKLEELKKLRDDVHDINKQVVKAQTEVDRLNPNKLAPEVAQRMAEGDAAVRIELDAIRSQVEAIRI